LWGSVRIADNEEPLGTGEVGWLDRRDDDASTVLRVGGGPDGGRVLIYAGRRQNEPTFQRGPFVAGSPAAIEQMHHDYRAGLFVRTAAPV
jgi:redox-sensitive bicupin YhaK (pirin superfamily)